MKEEEQRPRRKSIEFEDPSIVAFSKSADGGKDADRHGNKTRDGTKGKDGENNEKQKGGDAERWKNKESNKNEIDEADRKKRNKVWWDWLILAFKLKSLFSRCQAL